ncbi:MAG TPA: hypothetical protein VGG33_03970, partial [Polyangia bacterium]
PLLAQAQTEPAPAPAVEAAPAPAQAELAAVTLPAPVQVAQAAPVVAPASPEPMVAATAAPPAVDEGSKPLEVNVWGRIGNSVVKPKSVDADTMVDAEVDLLLNGRIHKYVGWTADFVATYGPGTSGTKSTASILDLIGKFEFADAFNVWFGRMLVPSDRSNFSGPWFMSAWNYPGFYQPGPPTGPRQGAFGRNDGATVWGQFGGGLLKYYAGAFGLSEPGSSPLYTSRINLSLINPEPGYYHSSTYYGGKDILALGLSAQYQKNGSVGPAPVGGMAPIDDFSGVSADLLFEKNTGAGTIDLEGAFYLFNGDNELVENHFYALASYLIPGEIGIGRLQPLVRYQQATPKAGGTNWKIMDAQIGYAIKEYAARLALGYQRKDLGGDSVSNAFILGIQLQK